MRPIVAPLRGAMGSGSVTVKHTTSSMRQYVAPPSGDNLWITRPPSGGYILCQCDITSHRLRRAYYILCLGSWFTYYILCQCDKMSHRPAGGTISSGTTSCGLASLGILHVARPFGALRGVVSMRQNVAAPSGG